VNGQQLEGLFTPPVNAVFVSPASVLCYRERMSDGNYSTSCQRYANIKNTLRTQLQIAFCVSNTSNYCFAEMNMYGLYLAALAISEAP
jgi:hypothetical protein